MGRRVDEIRNRVLMVGLRLTEVVGICCLTFNLAVVPLLNQLIELSQLLFLGFIFDRIMTHWSSTFN